MTEPPVISVLLPYRDAAPTLGAAFESTLAQREVALELIALGDGSPRESAGGPVALAREPGSGHAYGPALPARTFPRA